MSTKANFLKITIAEDDVWYAEMLKHHLSLNPDYEVNIVSSGKELKATLHEKPDVITLDYGLPDDDGLKLLRYIKENSPDTAVIVISGQEDIKTVVSLLTEGARDYIVKDEECKERLWNALIHISETAHLKREVATLRQEVETKYDFGKSIIGSSPKIKAVMPLLEKAAKTKINVSITGETGTGKEVVAKAIHYNSEFKKAPFVAVNVSAIPSELIESELFGHEKGAFTGASARRIGKFEEAGNGTLFLDEIGEMDPNMQAKILRVLQEKEFTRIGSNKTVKTNCRIISATHKNLQEEVAEGNFRQDLFYRLIGLPIELPPLKDRGQDILMLSKHFIELFAKENGLDKKDVAPSAVDKLMNYHFPGNVRELKSIIDLAMVMSNDDTISDQHITFYTANPVNELRTSEMTLKEYNFRILQFYMDKYNNNVLKVAEVLNIGKSTIYRMLQEIKES